MNKVILYNDDCLNILKTLDDNSIDSCVTDPPYGLSFMGKSWDYDVPKFEIWREVYRVLKPGAHLLAFFGSRTYHRGVVQIEDAGFEIRDQIMWIYGSGFPKSHNIGKAIDKEAGAKKNVIGTKIGKGGENLNILSRQGKNDDKEAKGCGAYGKGAKQINVEIPITEPATEEAKQWEGWGTALKPAHEPIVVARKPITQSVAKNVLEYGTGALNIDDCRVQFSENDDNRIGKNYKHNASADYVVAENKDNSKGDNTELYKSNGRWPANVIHDGSDEVVSQFPNESSRFFYCAKASKSDRDDGLDEFLEKKVVTFQTGNGASGNPSSISADRDTQYKNIHPTVKPTDLMKYLCRFVTPKNGIILDPFMGSGSTGKAALSEGFRFVGIEMNKEYFEIAEARIDASDKNSLEDFFK